MHHLYTFGIHLYGLLIRVTALFNPKATAWIKGRKGLFRDLIIDLDRVKSEKGSGKLAWFHCASLGEFEQGRPLIEEFRRRSPGYVILLTFFSPSGYENRKNYAGADLVFYLPLDTKKNASLFISITDPEIAFFVKYEFWFNYLHLLQKRGIPHYLISAIFRPDQHFFKWYGDWSRRILQGFTHIFVQNDNSKELLQFVGITRVTVSGDTRFDRVSAIAMHHKENPLLERFSRHSKVLVAGSTWSADEKLLIKFVQKNPGRLKMIIAPHELHEDSLDKLSVNLGSRALRYSKTSHEDISDQHDILILDVIGILSQAYHYGHMAYVGGGFGAGIHNILEPAVYGIPVMFGPNYYKFNEAIELIKLKGAFVVHTYNDLSAMISSFLSEKEQMSAGEICRDYVQSKAGVTKKIMDFVVC